MPQQTERIRILVADDHAIVREGLRALIGTEPDMELVGEAADGDEAATKARLLKPDVILLDLVMPHKGGLAALGELKREDPEVRILVLTSFAETDKVLPAIKAGASGYLLKDSSPQDLLKAIRDIHAGEASLHPTIARKVMNELHHPQASLDAVEALTARETEILGLVAQGLTNQDIAERLSLSERTVRTHVSNILAKLNLTNRTQAARFAIREGLTPVEGE